MKKAYIYPVSIYLSQTIQNPYLESFLDSFETAYTFVNKEVPSNRGILDLIKYVRKIDTIFLNWIEDLPDKRGGMVQSFFFMVMVFVLKALKVKIIWVMHNKKSHYDSNWRLKGMIFRLVLNKSDLILTHSKEGLRYMDEYKLRNKGKARYFPHPLTKKSLQHSESPSIDILIWGSIIPYKGIDRFLSYLHEHNLENRFKILVAGYVKPPEYEDTILQYCNDSIRLDNRYLPEEEVKQYMGDSKFVLFTYVGNSVLSSGALMESLAYGLNVVAPHVGAFKDASEEGLIDTFESFDDLIRLLEAGVNPGKNRSKRINQFIQDNDWHQFAGNVTTWINGYG